MQKDYYKVLGVDPKASDDIIKKAYRKLAVKHHPDKVRGQGKKKAEERFKEITEAYYILGNSKKKREYDDMRTGRGAYGFKGNFANAQGFDFEEILKQFHTSPGRPSGRRRKSSFSIFDDIFEDPSFSPRGRNMNYRFVNNEDDARRTASLSSVDTDQRSVLKIPMMLAAGGGSVSFKRAGRSISVKIPAGIQEGKSIRLKGEGKECPCCGKKGDLLLKISLK